MHPPLPTHVLYELADQLTPKVFHDLMEALPVSLQPSSSDPRWGEWMNALLQRNAGAIPVEVMAWMEQRSPGVFLNTQGRHEHEGDRRAWALFRSHDLDPQQQKSLVWLIQKGYLLGSARPRYVLEDVLSKQWWPVAEALLARTKPESEDGLAAVLGDAAAKRALIKTPEAWAWLLRQDIDLHAPVVLHGLMSTPPSAVGSMGVVPSDPVVPLWMKLAAYGLEAAGAWGKVHAPDRHAETPAWACAVSCSYFTSQATPAQLANMLRQHPQGLQGLRPDSGVPEAWLAIALRPELLDVLTDDEVVSIPPTPTGQSLWFALAHHLDEGLTETRVRRLRSLVPLTVDGRGRGLVTGGALRAPASWPRTVRTLFHRNPALAWGTSEEEVRHWAAAHAAYSWGALRSTRQDPVWAAACLHPHPEAVSPLLRGMWTVAALRTDPEGSNGAAVKDSLRSWLAADIEWPEDRCPQPPQEEEGPPTIMAEMMAHPCWPMVAAHLQAQTLSAACGPEAPSASPVRLRM